MQTYIIRRILQMILVLFLVTIIVFFMVRLLPGDPILLFLSAEDVEDVTQEQLDFIRHEAGLDRPMIVQYFTWLGDVLTGDLGTSIVTKRPIIDDVKRRLPVTFHIGSLAFLISIIVGITMVTLKGRINMDKAIDFILLPFMSNFYLIHHIFS